MAVSRGEIYFKESVGFSNEEEIQHVAQDSLA